MSPNSEVRESKRGQYYWSRRLILSCGSLVLVALGDSFTFGSGVTDSETWCSQLQTMSDGRLSVINAGVPGWGIFQMEKRLEQVNNSVRPDFVVVSIIEAGSLRQPFESEAERQAYIREHKFRNSIRRSSKLLTFIGRRVQELKLIQSGRATKNARSEETKTSDGPSEVFKSCWEQDRQRLLAMKELTERRGATFILMAWPMRSRNREFFLQRIAELRAQHGFLTVSLAPILARYPDRHWQLPNDQHPNATGYRFAAAQVLQTIFSKDE